MTIEALKCEVAARKRQRLKSAIATLVEMKDDSFAVTACVNDCNGEPGNGWTPDLTAANLLINRAFWNIVRIQNLLEGKDTGDADIELAIYAECINKHNQQPRK